MNHRATLIGLALAGVLALGMGVWLGDRLFGQRPAPASLDIAGIYLTDRRPFEEFRLIHHSGQPFTRADLKGKWTFLYFGYSFCPDVCPVTLVELNRLQKLLAGQGADADTAYVFVSVDPQRDTPQRLQEYVTYFNPKFQGATGPAEELSRLTRPLHVFYQRGTAAEGSANYTVDHTSTVTLIDPEGLPRAIFTPPQNPERMAQDFLKIRAASS
ncbi:MAG: SCO family protein [Candidatus Competibacteraceae bacterium]|nr:SCO family protein [Candidatus Competibacteraceae bacterium]